MTVRIIPPAPVTTPDEKVLWAVRKDARTAEGRLRVVPHGLELRILYNSELHWSRVWPDRDHLALKEEAARAHDRWLERGWTDAAR